MPYKNKEMKSLRQKERRMKPQNTKLKPQDYPSILYALTDPVKREKLEKICDSLGKKRLLHEVFYGFSDGAIDFDMVNELLEATR